MRDFIIVTDSSNDLPAETIEKNEIQVAPLTFSFGDKQYHDLPGGKEMDIKTFFQKLRSGQMAATSQVTPAIFLDLFSSILKKGQDLIYIGFSSALSGTCQSAKIAAEKLAAVYPKQKILVLDSLSGSFGQGLLVEFASMLKQSGKSIQEVYEKLVQKRLCTQHWFTVDDLNFLRRGGRISAALAAAGSILNIKPILSVNKKGQIHAPAKVRGRKQSLSYLVEKVAETFEKSLPESVYIAHADCPEDGQTLADMIKERVNPKEIFLHYAGPIISAHVGPAALGVFFFGKPRAN